MNKYITFYENFSATELIAESDKLHNALMRMEEVPDLIDKLNALNAIMQTKIDSNNQQTKEINEKISLIRG